MNLQDKCDTLDWALTRAMDWLRYCDRGESLVEIPGAIQEITNILKANGLALDDNDHLIEVDP